MGGKQFFLKNLCNLPFTEDLSIEATFSQTQFAGQYSAFKGSLLTNL
jgi:hypothetical protein